MDHNTKIRSDYHQQAIHAADPSVYFRRWARPSAWIILGFIIGLMCTHIVFSKHVDQIIFNEKIPHMAYKTSTVIIEEVPSTANA